jgi:4-amino-4-deoxy-L-arabinose transferase-like glycosyltransferase
MRRDVAIIVGLCLALFFLNMGGWDLWNPDEPRYAEVAREMIVLNDYVIPHLNGEVYTDKPPLFFWLIAGFMYLLGEGSTAAARLPSAIFATATAILTYFLGRFLFGWRVGLFSALVLVTNGEFFWLARRANIDCTLTFFTTLAIVLFWVGHKRVKGKGLFFSLSFLSMGLGFLAKLQVAVVVPVLALACTLLLLRRFDVFTNKWLYISSLCFFLPVLSWLVPAYLKGGEEYVISLLYEKTTAIFFKEVSHPRPFYYYLENFPLNFLPWFFFFPTALILCIRGRERGHEGIMLILSWFVASFLFFSVARGKRELYLLPLYPAASLMVGYLFDRASMDPSLERRFVRLPAVLLGGFVFLCGFAVPFLLRARFQLYLERLWGAGFAFSILLCLFGLCLLFLGRGKRTLYMVTGFTSSGLIISALLLFPALNPLKSARAMAIEVRRLAGSEERLAFYEMEGAQFNFYTGFLNVKRLRGEEDLLRYLQDERRPFCLIEKSRLNELGSGLSFSVAAFSRIGSKEYLLISGR